VKNGCFFISAEMLWPFQTEGEQRLLTNVLHRLHLGEGNEEGAYTQWKRHSKSNMEGQGLEEETENTYCCAKLRWEIRK
jgi:hypothetical protein